MLLIFPTLLILVAVIVHGWKRRFGFLSKISAISGIRFAVLEENRFRYFATDSSCRCHPNFPNSPFWKNPEQCQHRSKSLVISFAGAALLVGGHTFTEFKRTLDQIQWKEGAPDLLFVTDPAQSFFIKSSTGFTNLQDFTALLAKYRLIYDKIMLIGASLGATGVMMLADQADVSVAFNPIVNPAKHSSWIVRSSLRLLPEEFRGDNINKRILKSIENLKKEGKNGRLFVHMSGQNGPDHKQARFLVCDLVGFSITEAQLPRPVKVFVHQDIKEHHLPGHLKSKKQLLPILEFHEGGEEGDREGEGVESIVAES